MWCLPTPMHGQHHRHVVFFQPRGHSVAGNDGQQRRQRRGPLPALPRRQLHRRSTGVRSRWILRHDGPNREPHLRYPRARLPPQSGQYNFHRQRSQHWHRSTANGSPPHRRLLGSESRANKPFSPAISAIRCHCSRPSSAARPESASLSLTTRRTGERTPAASGTWAGM